MRITPIVIGSVALVAGLAGLAAPAAAADTVPVTLKVKDCKGCSVMATWSKTGKANGTFKSKTKKAKSSSTTLTFNVPKGYYLYFTATSPKAAMDAASVMVTQFVGKSTGDKVSASAVPSLNDGASYCMKAKKTTLSAKAALIPAGSSNLLAFWANPPLKAMGTKINDGISGVYGTQNTLLCKGAYY